MQTKGLLIGKNARNLRNMEKNIRRYFEVKEIRVV
jgi:ribosomal protein S3